MKVETKNGLKTFDDVEIGEVFIVEGGECPYLRIEVDTIYTFSKGHNGLAVNLETGHVTWFDNDIVRILPDTEVVC